MIIIYKKLGFMNQLTTKSLLIFLGLLIILALCATFPTPTAIGILTVFGSLLIVYQAIIILKDEEQTD